MQIHDCIHCGQRYVTNHDHETVHVCGECSARWVPVDRPLPVIIDDCLCDHCDAEVARLCLPGGVDTAATLGNTEPALAKSSAGFSSLERCKRVNTA